MKIADFAQGRGEKTDTIRKYVNRHPEEFAGLIKYAGKSMILSPEAVKKLDAVYPLPKPVEVVDVEMLRELAECRKELAEAHRKLAESAVLVAQAEAAKLLLEDREAELAEEKLRNRELAEALEKERAKTWWQKLRGK